MKIIKDILKYTLFLWILTALLVIGFEIFLKINTNLIVGILTITFTAILSILNKHNFTYLILDLVLSFIISIIIVWGGSFLLALVIDFGKTTLPGISYLIMILSIATIASISKNKRTKN